MPRPAKAQGAHLVITQIRIPGPLKKRLEKLSLVTGYAQQEHMRRAIDEYVTRQEEKLKPGETSRTTPRPFRRVGTSAAA